MCFRILWSGIVEYVKISLVKWQAITRPKEEGGLGLKNVHLFRISLAAKNLQRILTKDSLWRIIEEKYIKSRTLIDWIRSSRKNTKNVSNHWKAFTSTFPVVWQFFAWKVGNGEQIQIESDAITRCRDLFLPKDMTNQWGFRGFISLN